MRENQLDINPYVLPETTSWKMAGIHYRDAIFDLLVEKDTATVKVTKGPSGASVHVKLADDSRSLVENESFRYNRQAATISVVGRETSTGPVLKASISLCLLVFTIFAVTVCF